MVLLWYPCEWNITVKISVYPKKFVKKGNVGRNSKIQIILVGMRKREEDRRSVPAHCQAYIPRQSHSNNVMLKKK